jgi:hypothetical protein
MTQSQQVFWLPKRGNTPEEYEDAFAADPALGRYAVADGATESSFAREWAGLLVDEFVQAGDAWLARLPDVQKRWLAGLPPAPYPWYAEAKVQEGAFATFLGLTVCRSPDGSYCDWQAVAIGDSCLFHSRGDELLAAFPLERSEAFTSVPRLLGSRTAAASDREKHIVRRQGQAQAGDRLWLMTDALAQCCLRDHEQGRHPWRQVESLLAIPQADQHFATWIEGLRNERRLRDDDVTLMKMDVS